MIAKFALMILAVLGLTSCSDSGSNRQPESLALPTFFNVSIHFKYSGRVYHETWVHECLLYSSDRQVAAWMHASAQTSVNSKWAGFAKRLPDGSAVFFQFRHDICQSGEVSNALFGAPTPTDLWRRPFPPDYQVKIDAAAASAPAMFLFPAAYWFDDPIHPKRIEGCVHPACVSNASARVRVLGVSGSPSQSAVASDPTQAIPALAVNTASSTRIVGYACWAVPVDHVPLPPGYLTPDRLLSDGEADQNASRKIGPYRATSFMADLRIGGYPFMNAWTYNGQPFEIETSPVTDADLADREKVERIGMVSRWSRPCVRVGDTIQMDGRRKRGLKEAIPVQLLPISSRSPRYISVDGQSLDAGLPVNNINKFMGPDWSAFFSAAAISNNRTFYLTEALLISPQSSLALNVHK